MQSPQLSFDVNGVTYTLYFGMASTRIFEEHSLKEYLLLVESGIEDPKKEDFDPVKSMANLVYSGLCNMADVNTVRRPAFLEAYQLTELIWSNKEICDLINEVWTNSQPVKEMLARLESKEPADEKKNTKQSGGKKLRHMQQAS